MAKSLRRASLVLFPALLAALLALSPLPASAAEKSEKTTQSAPVSPRAKNGWAYDMVRADEAHAMGYTGQGVRVAILDNGIDPKISEISSRVVATYDAVHGVNGQQEHGTATAGIVAAETIAEAGVGGVAPDVEILNVKVCVMSNCRDEAIVPGLRWAIDHGADVISMSFGGAGLNAGTVALIREATERGIVVIAAAGNSACTSIWESPNGPKNRNCLQTSLSVGYPASYPIAGLLSVGAVDRNRKRASYSSYNAQVDISAPGTGVTTTFPWGPYSDFGGTSAAAPVVSGVAALVKQAAPHLSAPQVQAVLQMSASVPTEDIPKVWDSCVWNNATVVWDCTNLSPAHWPARYYTGAGIVDAVAAVELAQALETKVLEGQLSAPSAVVSDASVALDWSASGLGGGPYAVLIDGDLKMSTSSSSTTLTELTNESSYSITVKDSLGTETLPTIVTPTAQTPVASVTLDRVATTYDDTYVYGTFTTTDSYGALVLSNGDVASCRGNSCDYSTLAGDYTASYLAMGPLGYLSEPSNEIAFSSTYAPEPANVVFSNITATTVDISWDAVPGASTYEYYDAGAGAWLETTETHVSISGLNTALYSTFRVRGFNRETNFYTLFTPFFWYFGLPPELPALTGIEIANLDSSGLGFKFDANPDAERLLFVRSDGKYQYMPASSPEINDHFNPDDYGKTYSYRFVAIDDMKYGTQYGQISDPITITVPFPRSNDRIVINGSNEPLVAGEERQFVAEVASGRTVEWVVFGRCNVLEVDGNRLKLGGGNGEGECRVDASVPRNASWFETMESVRFDLRRASERVSIIGLPSHLLFGKSVDLTATTVSGREVGWSAGEGCSITRLSMNRARLKALTGDGSCEVTARVGEDSWWGAHEAATRMQLWPVIEKITMPTSATLLDRKPIVLSFKTVSGRTVAFKSTSMCSVKRLSSSKIEVSSKYSFGSCTITASFAANKNTTAASAKLSVTLGRRAVVARSFKECE
jgi:subtilisin family serine protease